MYKIVDNYFELNISTDNKGNWKEFQSEEKEILNVAKLSETMVNEINFGVDNYDISSYKHLAVSGNDIMLSDEDYNNGELILKDGVQKDELILQFVYSHLVMHKTLFLHSSLVSTSSGEGIMFLGRSGIGKTTQAENWKKYRNAEIINGDKVFVKLNENGLYAYGSPWCGSSPYCLNKRVPLKMMIYLEQTKENHLRKLSEIEALQQLTDTAFYPRWFPEGMEKTMEVIDRLICDIPMYILQCRPDEDAVNLVETELHNLIK